MDISVADNEVYAWGNNSMGQCGQGNSTGPITKPKKVIGLDGVAIQQISAGTSHSLAWTALPRDRLADLLNPFPLCLISFEGFFFPVLCVVENKIEFKFAQLIIIFLFITL